MDLLDEFLHTTDWQVAPNILGEDEEQTEDLGILFSKASEYIKSFDWAPEIQRVYLAYGVGKVLALFLFCFSESSKVDARIWVVVGDVPSAYFVTDYAKSALTAIDMYCELMENWANSIMAGRSLGDVFPVDAVASMENARDLLRRLDFIRDNIVPTMED